MWIILVYMYVYLIDELWKEFTLYGDYDSITYGTFASDGILDCECECVESALTLR
jgi:hypothetical protein